jgi:hypothetical protein
MASVVAGCATNTAKDPIASETPAAVSMFAPGTEVLAPYYPHAAELTVLDNAREVTAPLLVV